MLIQTKTRDRAAQTSKSILQFLLKDHHPRDYAFRFWDGSVWDAEAGQPIGFTMVLRHPGALRAMFLRFNENALGQAYIYDDFDIEGNIERAFPMAEYLLGLHLSIADRIRIASMLLTLPSHHGPRSGRQPVHLTGAQHSTARDHQAVTYHYNTSNDFFALFLDKNLVYSCAYFLSPGEDLLTAQTRKLDYVCRKLRLKRGERLLDIGCGWGALIMHAAKHYGVSALGITLSEPQAKLANERIKQRGLSRKCRAEVLDYRELAPSEPFDKIASIGMVEHVGRSMLPEYFRNSWRLLRLGGVFLNHGIADNLDHRGPTFSQNYVFPDSEPVPIGESTSVAERVGFEVRDVESLREHYLLTLRHWVSRLEAHRAVAIRATDETTYRVWRLFMSAAAHGFDIGQTNVYQSLLVKPDQGVSGMPLSRGDWYKKE
ncbi:MAG: cyclopropane-fatty-acyl-phospholipid synthase family protein [Bacteroidota bacterium]|jgi:cyclopropane-fatty-acyl-phospholipid synthase